MLSCVNVQLKQLMHMKGRAIYSSGSKHPVEHQCICPRDAILCILSTPPLGAPYVAFCKCSRRVQFSLSGLVVFFAACSLETC